MSNDKFIGTWKLISADYRRANGEVIDMYGVNPTGRIIYDADGNMAVQIMRRDRPLFATGDRLSGAPHETQTAFRGYLGYFGTYTLDADKHTVTHHIEGAWHPNWVGIDLVRFYEFSGNRLTLRTSPLILAGAEAVGQLVWEKVKE
ncbi:MAG: lipocalin-like domain-containing protein [Chloroflexi bacterium]|nr:lipocalin-like domain-containing protein [Chloroflexota bacterium]